MDSNDHPDMPKQLRLFDESDPRQDASTLTACQSFLLGLQQPDDIPTEVRIVKKLTSRIFGSADSQPSAQHIRFSTHCTIYPVKSPLITECVYFYEQERLAIRYRMGFTDQYLHVDKNTVSDFWEAEQHAQFLYDNIIAARTPIYRPTQFEIRPERMPSEELVSSSLKAIASYVPSSFGPYFEKWLRLKSILLKVVPSRRTKCGDCRRRPSGEYVITLNETDDQLAFTFTFLHELGHAFAPRTRASKPHDKHWKLTLSNMLIDAIKLFPKEIEPYVAFVACNPPASQDICEEFFFGTYLGKDASTDLTFGKIESLRNVLKLERDLGIDLDRFKP